VKLGTYIYDALLARRPLYFGEVLKVQASTTWSHDWLNHHHFTTPFIHLHEIHVLYSEEGFNELVLILMTMTTDRLVVR